MKKSINNFNIVMTALCAAVFMFGQNAIAQETNSTEDNSLKEQIERNETMRTAMQENMKAISEAERKLTERRNVVLIENKDAVALSAEILEIENTVKAKRSQLNAIVEQDAEFAKLKTEVTEKREEMTAMRKKYGEEMAEEHRKRREQAIQK